MEINNFKKIQLDVSIGSEQCLKYHGGDKAVLYNATWNKLKEIFIDSAKMKIGKGQQNIKVDCDFYTTKDATLKLELRTAGAAEKVKKL